MLCFAVLCIPFTIADAEMMDEGRQKKMQRHGIFFLDGHIPQDNCVVLFLLLLSRREPGPQRPMPADSIEATMHFCIEKSSFSVC